MVDTTTHKILSASYYFPMVFNDNHKYVRSFQPCQFLSRMKKIISLPLKPFRDEESFQQWGLDFIRELKDNSSNGYRWVLIATKYFTRWVEDIPTKKYNE